MVLCAFDFVVIVGVGFFTANAARLKASPSLGRVELSGKGRCSLEYRVLGDRVDELRFASACGLTPAALCVAPRGLRLFSPPTQHLRAGLTYAAAGAARAPLIR